LFFKIHFELCENSYIETIVTMATLRFHLLILRFGTKLGVWKYFG